MSHNLTQPEEIDQILKTMEDGGDMEADTLISGVMQLSAAHREVERDEFTGIAGQLIETP